MTDAVDWRSDTEMFRVRVGDAGEEGLRSYYEGAS